MRALNSINGGAGPCLLEDLYRRYNHREMVHPDPLEFLYRYADRRDREVVGLIAAALAYGRVRQILKSVESVLSPMGASPYEYVLERSADMQYRDFSGFVHRFARTSHLVGLLTGMGACLKRFGSLYECFLAGFSPEDATTRPALTCFVHALVSGAVTGPGHLLADPGKNSACKRLHLYLRWMVRKDAVDPGGWDRVPRSRLIVPLDVHMHRIGVKLGFTSRKQADIRTALEVTDGFRRMVPEDPVKYDFSLTRPGIWGNAGDSP